MCMKICMGYIRGSGFGDLKFRGKGIGGFGD